MRATRGIRRPARPHAAPTAYKVHTASRNSQQSKEFIARTGESFDRFCAVSLREYVTGAESRVPETELHTRRQDLLLRSGEAVDLARPLASVNENAMQAIHGVSEMVYRYKFSAVPFHGLELGDRLGTALAQRIRVDLNSAAAFGNALTDERNIKRDRYLRLVPCSPLAYESVVEPAARQWLAASPAERSAFWTYRRARPLEVSLPMHEAERRAMVAGWLLGWVVGFVRTPELPFTQPVRCGLRRTGSASSFPAPPADPAVGVPRRI